MKPDPHCKSPRRAGWAALAVALFALPSVANAQGLFFLFGNPSPNEIERRLEASGYVLTGPVVSRGDVYLADVVVRGEGPERLIIDPRNGDILQRFRGRGERWREAAAPPAAWGDGDPRAWNGPRPPADVGPGAAPPDAWAPAAPNVVETPKAAAKRVEPKPKPTPVANVAEPSVVPPSPAAAAKPAAPTLVKPAAEPTPAASAGPNPAPSLQAARADAPAVAVKPQAAAPTLPPSAKIKSINDIPVTPLD